MTVVVAALDVVCKSIVKLGLNRGVIPPRPTRLPHLWVQTAEPVRTA